MSLTINKFDTKTELATAFAGRLAELLTQAIEARGRASIAVSGGGTPLRLFDHLSQKDIDWSKVSITLADDRWVGDDNDASNAKLVREKLLKDKAAAATFVSLKTDFPSPEEGRAASEAAVGNMAWPLDVLILGMGGDGHTASLFPCSAELDYALSPTAGEKLVAVHPTTAPHARISFTLPALLESRQIFLHIEGEAKAKVLEEARETQNVKGMPIRAFLHQDKVPFEVYLTEGSE